MKRRTKRIRRFQDEQRALTMVYWQLKELKWHGVTMTTAVKAVLAKIRASKGGMSEILRIQTQSGTISEPVRM